VWASLAAQTVKNLPAVQENRVQSLGRKLPWRRAWPPTPVFLPGEAHGQGSLAVLCVAVVLAHYQIFIPNLLGDV